MPTKNETAFPGPINLALQDGGIRGACRWGVLDWILEGDRFIDSVSGTSASVGSHPSP